MCSMDRPGCYGQFMFVASGRPGMCLKRLIKGNGEQSKKNQTRRREGTKGKRERGMHKQVAWLWPYSSGAVVVTVCIDCGMDA